MTDSSIAPQYPTDISAVISEEAARGLGLLGELFTQWQDLTRTGPSIRQAAYDLLARRLPAFGSLTNPDILFINQPAGHGSLLEPVCLTDAVLRVLIQGTRAFEYEGVEVYTRHDSLEDLHRVPALSGQALHRLLAETSNVLPKVYKNQLDTFWAQPLPATGREGEFESRASACTSLYEQILKRELKVQVAKGLIYNTDTAVLRESFTGTNLYRISLTSPGGAAVMSSALVIPRTPQKQSSLTFKNCEGNVFLMTANAGLELYESLVELDQTLRARLLDAVERDYLCQDLLLGERAALADEEYAELEIAYDFSSEDLIKQRLSRLRRKQIEDVDFLIDRAQQTGQPSVDFVDAINAVGQLRGMDAAQKRHFQGLFNQASRQALPDWIKHAPSDAKATYRDLAGTYQQHADHVAQLMADLESIQRYASNKIDAYVLSKLGYRIDPEQVFISIRDEFALSATVTEQFNYRKSLLDFVVQGLPVMTSGMVFDLDVPQQSVNPAFDRQFVEEMITELDVQQHFELDTWRRSFEDATVQAMTLQRDSTIVLSAYAARLQGHLRDTQSQQLIEWVRGDQQPAGTNISMGGLAILASGNVLKDVLVLRMNDHAGEHYVLYAPGAPGGRDFFEFSSWQRLSIEVGGWLAKPEGVNYLLDQLPFKSRPSVASLIREVLLKPTEWRQSTALFVAMVEQPYSRNLLKQVRTKVAQDLSDTFRDQGLQDLSHSHPERRVLALLDARIDGLDKRFNQEVELQSYRDFIREQGRQWITHYLKAKGINLVVDPDTVRIDLYGGNEDRNPFRPVVEELTLTTLLMNDFLHVEGVSGPSLIDRILDGPIGKTPLWYLVKSAKRSFTQWYFDTSQPTIKSSIGQDLSALTLDAIRELLELPLGEHYITRLEYRLADPSQQRVHYRRALLAKRKYCEIYRDIVREYLNGRLSEVQYRWLIPLLGSVDTSSDSPAPADSSVNVLVFRNTDQPGFDKDCIIEGALTFVSLVNADPDLRLIYTPNAPDGICFRKAADIALSMKSPGMPAYYYERASYKDQRIVGTLVENLERDPETYQATFSTRVRPEHRITDLESLYQLMIQRMIDDVDEQTQSVAEKNAAIAYTVVRWTGTILFLPFPPAALGWGLTHASLDLIRGYLAYRDGDRATALGYFTQAYVGTLLAGGAGINVATMTMGLGWRVVRWASTDRLPILVV